MKQATAFGSGVLGRLHRRIAGVTCAAPVDMTGQVAVVTGCAPGSLGEATAVLLAERGAHVVVTRRRYTQEAVMHVSRLSLSAGVSGHDMDLQSRGSVQRFAAWVQRRHPDGIDVLVNNAGVHLDLMRRWKEPQIVDGHEVHWRTNYLGTAHLTQALLPMLLRRAIRTGDTRVVHVASGLHRRGRNSHLLNMQDFMDSHYDSWVAYGNSKLALMHHAAGLHTRYESRGVQAFSLHPGAVYTNVADRGLAGHALLQSVRSILAPVERFLLQTRYEGAQTALHCAGYPRLRGGLYFERCAAARASPELSSLEAGHRLWEQTQSWLR